MTRPHFRPTSPLTLPVAREHLVSEIWEGCREGKQPARWAQQLPALALIAAQFLALSLAVSLAARCLAALSRFS